MFRLNTLDLKRDRPNADGIVRAWFDGRLVIDRTDVILRSTDFPNMKFNQFLLAPYFGPGLLPHEQTLWIDELTVGTRRLGSTMAQATSRNGKQTMRVAAAQPRNRTIDFRLKPTEVLAKVDQSLAELEQLVHKAGAAGCDALALPEDTLGLLKWESANPRVSGHRAHRGREANARPARQSGGGTTACTWSYATTSSRTTAARTTRRFCLVATARRSAVTTRSTCR